MSKYIDKAVSAYCEELWQKLSQETKDLIHIAMFDLYFGPYQEGDDDLNENGTIYPGFGPALDLISSALEDLEIRDIYLDEWDNVYFKEPEPWQDEETGEWIQEDYYLFEAKELIEKILGKELSACL